MNLAGVEHDCGGHFELIEEPRDVTIGQSTVSVNQQFFRCNKCGEERQTLDQLDAARRSAASTLRKDDGLLSGAEIRRIREERLKISQGKLEQALGLGEKTVVRWETERVLQPKATDNLLRLLDRDPSALSFLAQHNGVEWAIRAELDEENEQAELEPACSLPIPRSYLTTIERAAAAEGVEPQAYVIWLLAEGITAIRTQTSLASQVAAMHKDLAGRMEKTWRSFHWPMYELDQKRVNNRSPYGLTERKPYAQSA